MAFDLKTTVQPNIERSTPEKKLNRLIDQIEQLKRELAAWENAKSDIQLFLFRAFLNSLNPIYFSKKRVQFWRLNFSCF